jgi:tRNA threonylcarbamoyladenosine biosynthesis protein TsaE
LNAKTLKQLTYNISEIKTVAQQLWDEYSSKKIWAFHAAMGSGKTTLIHALCEILQVKDAVSSPTFAIINEYTSPVAGTIFHIDGYRMKDETEAIQAGCEDCIESGNYCFIEWPEKFPELLPEDTLHISLEAIDNKVRKLVIL